MSFSNRLENAIKFENWTEDYCAKRMKSVARNGTEHTHPEFVALLRTNNKPRSKFVRFAPDGVMLKENGSVFHWEAKNSVNIEKDAYETYLKYEKVGCTVIVFVKDRKGNVYYQNAGKISFLDSHEHVSKFPNPLPVENGWISPRAGHGTSGKGSGTPYKVVNISSLVSTGEQFVIQE